MTRLIITNGKLILPDRIETDKALICKDGKIEQIVSEEALELLPDDQIMDAGQQYVSPGFINEKVTVFVAEGLIKVENPLAQDEDEQIELVEYTRQEVKTMLDNDEVRDMKTTLALNYWLYQKGE